MKKFCKKLFTKKNIAFLICLLVLAGILCMGLTKTAYAAELPGDVGDGNLANTFTISFGTGEGNGSLNGALRILFVLTAIALIPFLLLTITSFTRIIIVLHFTRTALNTQTAPPNQVLIAIAIFLTAFIMMPTFTTSYQTAIVPFNNGEITQEEAFTKAMEPFREFMFKQTQRDDIYTFMEISGHMEGWDLSMEAVPTYVLIPSFILSELREAFIIGFLIYIPFVVIDMVVSSILMSMGMMMLPPTTISMPFKILLFILADGWNLVIVGLVNSFY